MDFTLNSLHQTDEDLETVFKSIRRTLNIDEIDNMNHGMLMKQNKETLANFVEALTGVLSKSQNLLKSAAANIDELKTDQLKSQKSVINLQEELIRNKSEQLDSVKTTVKTEMKSWTDVVKQSCSKTVTPKKIKEAVKSAVSEEDRSRNFMMFGLEEEDEEADRLELYDDEKIIDMLFERIEVKPRIEEHYRVGKLQPGSNRPIKVRLSRSDSVMQVLSNAKKLKGGPALLSSVFLAPDRSKEERIAHKRLVDLMKKKMEEEPDKHFYIRYNKICSADKLSTAVKSS